MKTDKELTPMQRAYRDGVRFGIEITLRASLPMYAELQENGMAAKLNNRGNEDFKIALRMLGYDRLYRELEMEYGDNSPSSSSSKGVA